MAPVKEYPTIPPPVTMVQPQHTNLVGISRRLAENHEQCTHNSLSTCSLYRMQNLRVGLCDYKNPTRVSFRRIYGGAGGEARRTTGLGSRTCLLITSIAQTTVKIPCPYPGVRPSVARCISAKTVLWWSTKRCALSAATAAYGSPSPKWRPAV